MTKTLAALAGLLLLAGCGDPSSPKTPETGGVQGHTQVFDVSTPDGPVTCITWSEGYGGGLDCDWDGSR